MPCTNRNPNPPCEKDYYEKKNPKGDICCYKKKNITKENKSLKKNCFKDGNRCKVYEGPMEPGCMISDKGRCVVVKKEKSESKNLKNIVADVVNKVNVVDKLKYVSDKVKNSFEKLKSDSKNLIDNVAIIVKKTKKKEPKKNNLQVDKVEEKPKK